MLREVSNRRTLTAFDDFGTHAGNFCKARTTLLEDILARPIDTHLNNFVQ